MKLPVYIPITCGALVWAAIMVSAACMHYLTQ